MKISIDAVRKAQEKASDLLSKAIEQREQQIERNDQQVQNIHARSLEIADEISTLRGS